LKDELATKPKKGKAKTCHSGSVVKGGTATGRDRKVGQVSLYYQMDRHE